MLSKIEVYQWKVVYQSAKLKETWVHGYKIVQLCMPSTKSNCPELVAPK